MRAIVGPDTELLEKLSKDLEVQHIPIEMRVFPDGEACPRISSIEGVDVAYLFNQLEYSNFNPNRYLMEYYFAAKSLVDMDVSRIDAIIPYLPYGRQDKSFRHGEPFLLKYVLELLSEAGISRLYTLMAHIPRLSDIMDREKRMRVVNLSVMDAIAAHVQNLALDDPFVIGPDNESEKWADAIATRLETDYVFFDKKRDVYTGEVRTTGELPSLTGRDVLVIDDIISTGRTIENAVKIIKAYNPGSIHVIAVHGIFSSNAIERLAKYNISIVTSNTINNPFSKICIEGTIARAIKKW